MLRFRGNRPALNSSFQIGQLAGTSPKHAAFRHRVSLGARIAPSSAARAGALVAPSIRKHCEQSRRKGHLLCSFTSCGKVRMQPCFDEPGSTHQKYDQVGRNHCFGALFHSSRVHHKNPWYRPGSAGAKRRSAAAFARSSCARQSLQLAAPRSFLDINNRRVIVNQVVGAVGLKRCLARCRGPAPCRPIEVDPRRSDWSDVA